MRRMALVSLLLTVMIGAFAGGTTAKSIKLPVDPSAVGLADHPLAGTVVIVTPAGAIPATLGADGSLLLEFPTTAFGNDGFAFVGVAAGTWTPVGAQSATFTAVQPIYHANGIYLGSVTFEGSLAMRDDPALTDVVVSFDRITVVDGRNNRIALANVGAGAASSADYEALLGNGGRDCTWCGTAAAGDISAASGSPVEAVAADARYIAADAASVPLRNGGGCNTCR